MASRMREFSGCTLCLDGMLMTYRLFGNMLVLSAVWRTQLLRRLVDQDRFQGLLERTISFLDELSAISPTCQHDCDILKKIRRVLFGGRPD
jgi:hypothetical protein